MLSTLTRFVLLAILLAGAAVTATAQTVSSGSTGADGAFAPTSTETIQLPASGVYNFTTINIPSNVTVTIVGNATNTPVTMLASGNVTIAGTLNVSGKNGTVTQNGSGTYGAGGPGGFNGGGGVEAFQTFNYNGVAGDGPGGGGGGLGSADGSVIGGGGGGGSASVGFSGTVSGNASGPNDGAGGPFYGAASLLQLIGGSGGGGGGSVINHIAGGGGGGGGAIVLASSGTIAFTNTGVISAYGGQGGAYSLGYPLSGNYLNGGGGAGGAIRLVATTLTGSPTISVSGGLGGIESYGSQYAPAGNGGSGFARFEAYNFNLFVPTVSGTYLTGLMPSSITLPNPPALKIVSVAGVLSPTVPKGDFNSPPDITLPANASSPAPVALAAVNVPVGTVLTVQMTPQVGPKTYVSSTALAGTAASSTASASVTLPASVMSVLIASCVINVAVAGSSARPASQTQNTPPLVLNGEKVAKIEVSAAFGGPSVVTYITTSGKRYARRDLWGAPPVKVVRK